MRSGRCAPAAARSGAGLPLRSCSARAVVAALVVSGASVLAAAVAGCGSAAAPGAGDAVTAARHPLDPLSADEIAAAARLVRGSGQVPPSARFVEISLEEPPKEDVLAFRPDGRMERRAFAVLLDPATARTLEAVLDVTSERVVSVRGLVGAQPLVLQEEYDWVPALVRTDERFARAMALRGIADLEQVFLNVWAGGSPVSPQEQGRRVLRAVAYYADEATDFQRPLGVVAYVDATTRQVTSIVDPPVAPLAPPRRLVRSAPAVAPPSPAVRPAPAPFLAEGHSVSWRGWRFRWSVHPRSGLVLYQVAFGDEGARRSILYRASLSEMLVPYGDPGDTFFWRTAFDVGEYGLGKTAQTLVPGQECPADAAFFDAVLADEDGAPYTDESVVCLFERDGDIGWTEYQPSSGTRETHRARELVLRFMSQVGNYGYGINWLFHEDGTLEQVTEAHGVVDSKEARSATLADDPTGAESRHGDLVDEHVLAPFHQHFFNFRLDLDVDGTGNSVIEADVVAEPVGPANPKGNAFGRSATLLRTERAAQREVAPERHREWTVVNDARTDRLGYPVGYRLVPGENARPFADSTHAGRRRGRFVDHHLWVTPYAARELYAAGDYPNQSPGADGLPAWTAGDRSIAGTDVVLWYTMGVTHLPRPEEWPVMSGHRLGFQLEPVHFFDLNPAVAAR